MKRKNAFTITELLGVLVILGVIMAIAVPSISKLQDYFKKSYYEKLEGSILSAAKTYYKDNSEKKPNDILDYEYISFDDLTDKKYLDEIKGYRNDSIEGGVFIVNVGNTDKYIYKECYEINGVKKYKDVKYGESKEDNICYFKKGNNEDKITNNFDSTEPLNIHVNTYTQKEFKEQLGINRTFTRQNNEGKALYIIKTDEVIYPLNITALDVKEAENEKTIIVKYRKPDLKTIDVMVNFFQHKTPTISNIETGKILINKLDPKINIKYDGGTFGEAYNSSFKQYEYSIDGGKTYNPICINTINCNYNVLPYLNKQIRIRVMGTDRKNSKTQEGKSTNDYLVDYKKIKVKFNPNGGALNGSNEIEVVPGDNYSNFPTVTKSGFKFINWVDESNKEVKEGTKIETTDDITLTAIWENATYNISYNSNGGVGDMTPTQCIVGNDCILKTNTFTKEGYTFTGWDIVSDGSVNYNDNAKVSFVQNTTLYAQWQADKYKVGFDGNGGTTNPEDFTVEVRFGENYNALGSFPDAQRSGYSFNGWYTQPTEGTQIYDASIVNKTGDHTLYAHWTANKYKVTFDANGGETTPNPIVVTYDSEYGPLPTPQRTGYTFDGWYTSDEVTNIIPTTKVTIATDHTLYAHWTANKYKITFDANGGEVTPQTTLVTYDLEYGSLPTPTKTGYSFTGWYTEKSGTSQVTSTDIVKITEEQTLYALWIKESSDPTIQTVATGISYQVINNNSTIFSGGTAYISAMIYDVDQTVTKVESKNNSESYTQCTIIEKPGERGDQRFDNSLPEYKDNIRYYCGPKNLTAEANIVTTRVTYKNNQTKTSSLTIKTTTNKCPNVSVSEGMLGNNGWYKSQIALSVNSTTNTSIKQMKWYTNALESQKDITIGSDHYKYWTDLSITATSYPSLSSSTISGFATRKYIIKTYDMIGSQNNCFGSYKIDAEPPTMQIIMKQLGHSSAGDSNYTSFTSKTNYVNNREYSGGTVLIYTQNPTDGNPDKSGVASYTCTPTGADANRNASPFPTFRNIVRYGTTTINCSITDKAGNTSNYTRTIKNTHQHVYGNGIAANKTSVKSDAIYNNYRIAKYDWDTAGLKKAWVHQSCGHSTHYYNSNNNGALVQCVYCGATVKENGGSNGTWWCPRDTKRVLSVSVYGCSASDLYCANSY